MTQTMLWITSLGNWKFVVATALLVAGLFWLYKKPHLILPFWATLAGTEITVEILKILIRRPRPIGAEFLERSFSFPSGHAAIAVALYGFIAFALARRKKNHTIKGVILMAAFLIMLLVGLSRIYLGVHYPTDVAAGYLIGLGWLWASIRIYNKR